MKMITKRNQYLLIYSNNILNDDNIQKKKKDKNISKRDKHIYYNISIVIHILILINKNQ